MFQITMSRRLRLQANWKFENPGLAIFAIAALLLVFTSHGFTQSNGQPLVFTNASITA